MKEVTNQITFNVISMLAMSQRICDTPDNAMQRLKSVGDLVAVIMGVPMLGDYFPWMQIFEIKKVCIES